MARSHWLLRGLLIAFAATLLALMEIGPVAQASSDTDTLASGVYAVVTANAGTEYPAVWTIVVTGGSIVGSSQWTCCPGPRTDPLSGSSGGGKVTINRDCSGQGQTSCVRQTYVGTITAPGQVSGTWSGDGAEGDDTWSMQARAPPTTLSVGMSPSSATVAVNGTTSLTVTVKAVGGAVDAITLAALVVSSEAAVSQSPSGLSGFDLTDGASKTFDFKVKGVSAGKATVTARATGTADGNPLQGTAQAAVTVSDALVVNTASDAAEDEQALSKDPPLCSIDLNASDQECSLRAAIQVANKSGGDQTISFDILGPGVPKIAPGSALPVVSAPRVTIDGSAQPGGWVELNGAGAGDVDGLEFTGGQSSLSGFVVNGWKRTGIEIADGGGDSVTGNRIGTNADGTSAVPNGNGIVVEARNSTIGGPTSRPGSAPGNLISGNDDGIFAPAPTCDGCTQGQLTVIGNLIGSSVDGTTAIPNATGGFLETFSQFGGASADDGNVVVGNTNGIDSSGTIFESDRIGVTLDGSALANKTGLTGSGVLCGDVISGNGTGASGVFDLESGNRIGTNAAGTVAIPNQIGMQGTVTSIRGKYCPDLGPDLISGNTLVGIKVGRSTNEDARVGELWLGQAYVGTDISGTKAIPNGVGIATVKDSQVDIGVSPLESPGSPEIVTSGCDYPCVVISGNLGAGLGDNAFSINDATGVSLLIVRHSAIGVSVDGEPLGNRGDGIDLGASGAPLSYFEKTSSGITDNVISDNGGDAIQDESASPASDPYPIAGNSINGDVEGGISLESGADLDITGNKISNTQVAITVAAKASPQLHENSIFDNAAGYRDFAPGRAPVTDVTATSSGSSLQIKGRLPAGDAYRYRIDVYGDTSCVGTPEGRYYLGQQLLPFDYFGTTFKVSLASLPLAIKGITVTVTDLSRAIPGAVAARGPTSDYSDCADV